MESLSSVSTSIVLPPFHHHHHRRRLFLRSSSSSYPTSCLHSDHRNPSRSVSPLVTPSNPRLQLQPFGTRINGKLNAVGNRGGSDNGEDDDDEVDKALRLDGTIPGSSNEFVEQVSSRAYDMRRHLQQTFDSSSYDVLEANPWREDSKAVYVLTRRENQLCTMKTRMNRSEVERELGMLFSKGRKLRNQTKKPSATKFQMLVEDVRDGVLVFEDETEAAKYCDLLQGGGQGCEGVAEVEASSVFDMCRKMRALAVLFRRGRTPPLPESLKLNLSAKKRSLEDQDPEEDFI
ncbi:hypothetical protein HanRHA438_Chr12g0571901 [Helianthus annuus]|uniref:Uncharacterized protein n=1 Tax=Helianthus annuus TaxID=4232 RepID=A0A9K3HJN6_HELAN|nr:uncharacterized protein LOC110895667 [Helianthus annuus]KAF5779537.1 hypothetical protein HanXRQr2_Chr12g0560661 [Helianthus annuus]KAJ0490802.1 hypothetical protein HanHA300_Chr12g0459721 [Helianthus annuus]KAJ0506708.1 hypothetical protein HanHA89_Chr12g0485151 [Helianthus annuus]KAJ0676385.1 hypothetical protein HanLR1_Chr12g0462151 [Helianthus annuus]KAJ0868199.1 hypothetical protein HanRHA438_Chr12g0571901 [Helianthus annuus]